VGAAEEGRSGCDARGGQTGLEARRREKPGQELNAVGRATAGGWPSEGGANATGRGEGARRESCGAGDDGGVGWERAGRHGGIGKGHRRLARPGTRTPCP
jgi:hypothetical protein